MKKKLLSGLTLLLSAVAIVSCDKTKPNVGPVHDYSIIASHATGEYVYNSLNEGLANYYIMLSEMEVSADLKTFSKPGMALVVDLYAMADANMMLPTGTYKFTSAESGSEFAMSIFTNLLVIDDKLSINEIYEFASATLEVTKEGDVYTLFFTGTTLEERKKVYCAFTGKIAMHAAEGGIGDSFPPLENNVSADFIDQKAYYLGKNAAGVGQFSLRFFEYEYDGYNHPGAALMLELNSNIVNDMLVPVAGTYTVATTGAAGTLTPGVIDEVKLQNLGTTCLFVTVNGDDIHVAYGVVNAGTVVIAVENDTYTVTADLVTDNGKTIKGQYKGVMPVIDRSYYSTLKEDRLADLADMPCEVEYYGQSLGNIGVDGDNWMIFITSGESGSDGAQINLVTPAGKFEDGLPTGEYNVTKEYNTGDYICAPGEYDNGELYCSWFVGNLLEGGIAVDVAPFREGIVLVDKTDGIYSIVAEVTDDAPKTPNTITIMWEGKISKYIDYSKNAQGSVSSDNIFKTNVKPRVEVLHNQYVPATQIKGSSYTNTLLRRTLLAR